MKATSYEEGFYHSHLYNCHYYDKCLIGTTVGDDLSKFEINMTSVFWENLAKLFLARQQQQEQQ